MSMQDQPSRKPSADVAKMSDGELADDHRGQSFAFDRAKDRIRAIEVELAKRKCVYVVGKLSVTDLRPSRGLLDLDRIRAEMGEDWCAERLKPGSDARWVSRTKTAAERAAC